MSYSKFLLFHLISLIVGSNYRIVGSNYRIIGSNYQTSSLDIPNISHSVCFLSAVNRTKTNITLCLNFLTLHSPFLMFCSKFRTSPLDIRKYEQLLTINLLSYPPPHNAVSKQHLLSEKPKPKQYSGNLSKGVYRGGQGGSAAP